jgi:hypothetical protein
MTPLRHHMTEDMIVRNFSPYTQRGYLFAVARFARAVQRSQLTLHLNSSSSPARAAAYLS